MCINLLCAIANKITNFGFYERFMTSINRHKKYRVLKLNNHISFSVFNYFKELVLIIVRNYIFLIAFG